MFGYWNKQCEIINTQLMDHKKGKGSLWGLLFLPFTGPKAGQKFGHVWGSVSYFNKNISSIPKYGHKILDTWLTLKQ